MKAKASCAELQVVKELGGEIEPADQERCGWNKPAPAPVQKKSPAPSVGPDKVVVSLAGGQEIRGSLLAETNEEVMLLLPDGETLTLPRSAVRGIRRVKHDPVDARGWPRDKNRSRYLYAPSAMPIPKGTGHFSQRELLFSSFSYGVHDNVSMQLGAMVPVWLTSPPETIHAIVGLKAAWELAPGWHAGGGFQMLAIPVEAGLAVGLVFGVVTAGDADAHVSLAAGVPWAHADGDFAVGKTGLFVLSGALRVSKSLALVTENWWISVPGSFGDGGEGILLDGFGVRFIGNTFSADVGLIAVTLFEGDGQGPLTVPAPLPWLDFSYHFGH
ncbi:MAG: hypothetical protein VYE15_03605 [Myxococcota bacterium]|nr:hypothetical protein [Myxococcota bacterium]